MDQLNFSVLEVESKMKQDSDLNLHQKLISNTKINSRLNFKSTATSNSSPQSDFNNKIWQKNIHHLKDTELESQLKLLVGRERQLLHLILKHIQEVDRRRLYAARAYSSLFAYLTKAMGYSFAAAQRRIEAARLMNQVPELALQIQKGDVNLSQIGIISQAVKSKESLMGKKLSAEIKREVIAKVAQKTSAQTQVLVAEKLDLPLQQPERKIMQKDQSCVISITLTPEQQTKLQRCRELLAAKLQQGSKAPTTVNYLEELMDFYLNKKDPCRESRKEYERSSKVSKKIHSIQKDDDNLKKHSTQDFSSSILVKSAKYEEFAKTSTCASESPTLGSLTSAMEKYEDGSVYAEEFSEHRSTSKDQKEENPLVPTKENPGQILTSEMENRKHQSVGPQLSLKKQLFRKWQGCQYHDPRTGRICGEKFQLEMEHLQPRWAGGNDQFENRTLLCRTHNQWKYRQQTGLH